MYPAHTQAGYRRVLYWVLYALLQLEAIFYVVYIAITISNLTIKCITITEASHIVAPM